MKLFPKAKLLGTALAAAAFATFASTASAVPVTSADVVFIVDESGSMAGEHAFLQNQIANLDAGLSSAGVTTRNYAVIGYGGSGSTPTPENVSGGLVGLSDAQTALGNLQVYGGIEDGYTAMQYALDNLTFTGQATNFILVTDEDRDVLSSPPTYQSTLNNLMANNVVLNAVINASLTDNGSNAALGIDSNGSAYIADGLGGYTTSVGTNCSDSYYNSTCADYVDMALATSGAAWDLNQLRAGDLLASSFTEAFLDIKVQEIITPPSVPEPVSIGMLGLGLIGLGAAARRKKQA